MFGLDAQALIGPVVVLMYLKDCLLLLQRDEAVLVRGIGRPRGALTRTS